MVQKLLIVVALVVTFIATGCKSGQTVTVDTPAGSVTVTYDGKAKEAYDKLEDALADCLNSYTAAVLDGDQQTADEWQGVMDKITKAKEDLSDDKTKRSAELSTNQMA